MRIGFKRTIATSDHLEHHLDDDAIHFTLRRGDAIITIKDWEQSQHRGAQALVQHMYDQSTPLHREDTSIHMTYDALMRWCDGQEHYVQSLLELPPLYSGSIQIESSGMFHVPEFTLSYAWLKPNGGNRYTSAKEQGCFLTVGGSTYMLPAQAWRLKNAVQAVQVRLKERTETTQRMLDWHEVQHLLDALPEDERQQTLQSSSLRNVRLYYANAFRLEALPTPSGAYDIMPVLMRQKTSVSATEDSPPAHEMLLTPAMQENYAKHYANANSISRCYSLDVGRYVILGEDVHRVLTHVQEVRKRSPEERLEFLKNPRAALMQEFEYSIPEEVFVAMLSERITGLGAWQKKIVPYIHMKGQQWLPDGKLPEGVERGIKIGDKLLPIDSEEDARDIIRVVQEAHKEGKEHFTFKGEEYPMQDGILQAVQQSFPPASPLYKEASKGNDDKALTYAIVIKDNFNELLYEVHATPRSQIPRDKHLPEQVKSTLDPHQKEGFDWLCRHYRTGSHGALLADDMGLGKTLQALVFLAWLKQGMDDGHMDRAPLLIVAPTGLLENWKQEIKTHLKDGLGNSIYAYGASLSAYKNDKILDTQKLQHADLILTTYETLNNYQTSFALVRCAAVVFDEMQKVKNPASQITNAVSGIYADFWLGMTGTPVENRLCDLWCITDILQPGWMGSIKHFSECFEKPLTQKPACYKNLEELNRRITFDTPSKPAYMMRRMKSDGIVTMPNKIEHPWHEEMPPQQASAYDRAITKAQEGKKGDMLMALQQMRAISLHPDYRRTSIDSDEDFINASARLKKCFQILEDIKKNQEKALIFVEYDLWHKFLPDMIAKYFGMMRPLSINGAVTGQERQKRVDHFQKAEDGFDVMLISPKAGGVGLTLTAANHVIHLTRWWNPAVEDQATDRVYRRGQKKEVHVHYPMAVHPDIGEKSHDLLLHELLENKRLLSKKSLIPLMDEAADCSHLFNKAVWQGKNATRDKQSIDSLTGQEFQQFITQRIQQVAGQYGLIVRSAVDSWDGGADIIIETHDGDMLAIIQCKHSGNPESTTTASPDIIRACANYGLRDGFGIAITNARASSMDYAWQKENPDKHMLLEGLASLTPESILPRLAEESMR
ncbi:MAG: hypothetical protein EAZ74_00725 [Alphaproteobacteria bacterium]|nr:MAG: hypothetical protein EAZ74_00725 [Alphaproteobacteria bacterium]TAF77271.1 MAG: hypothetical protein EAZ52_01690 [Alphaproteobacteria bacterium]